MKTILVPTDFSEAADNAIAYAVEMARVMKARIILFHAFHVPVVAAEAPVMIPLDELEKDCLAGLEQIARRIHLRYGVSLPVECICRCGFAVDEIIDYTSNYKTDLVVMGMQGAGFLAEKLLGSVTTTLIRRAKCPVMAIDKSVKFRSLKKVVLACDYEQAINKLTLYPLRELADFFEAHVYVLNVVAEEEPGILCRGIVPDIRKLKHSLAGIDHSFHYLQNSDVVRGINTFVEERQMDMVVMIPHKHSLLKQIFDEPDTKKMAFHSSVPLLSLPLK